MLKGTATKVHQVVTGFIQTWATEEPCFVFLITSSQVKPGCCDNPLKGISLCQAEQAHFPQPLCNSQVLQPPVILLALY